MKGVKKMYPSKCVNEIGTQLENNMDVRYAPRLTMRKVLGERTAVMAKKGLDGIGVSGGGKVLTETRRKDMCGRGRYRLLEKL